MGKITIYNNYNTYNFYGPVSGCDFGNRYFQPGSSWHDPALARPPGLLRRICVALGLARHPALPPAHPLGLPEPQKRYGARQSLPAPREEVVRR